MLRALFWKEWRESRLLLETGILLVVCFVSFYHRIMRGDDSHLTGGIFWIYHVMEPTFTRSSVDLTGISFIFLASLFGARAFSIEEDRLIFLLSKPVGRETIVTIKLASGLFYILIILLMGIITGLIINFPSVVFCDPRYFQVLIVSLQVVSLCYALSFFMSSLFLNITTSVLIGFFGTAYVTNALYLVLYKLGLEYFYPLFLPVLSLIFFFLSYFIFMRREVRR